MLYQLLDQIDPIVLVLLTLQGICVSERLITGSGRVARQNCRPRFQLWAELNRF